MLNMLQSLFHNFQLTLAYFRGFDMNHYQQSYGHTAKRGELQNNYVQSRRVL